MIASGLKPATFAAETGWLPFVSLAIVVALAVLIGGWVWFSRRRSASAALSSKELSAMEDGELLNALENLLMFEEKFTKTGDARPSPEVPFNDSGLADQTALTIALLRTEVMRRGLSC
ncbi:hypothetical protein [Arthrobacter cryoconiti]|uniref:Uncharacterized protein n=1 Tax=Arthrobacter cryoconiti TaxID=748907 RepID=A0ABV8R3Y2_9MICC|nr:hypothetical protein [Arthrobacter cryoconiti]MCC9066766.1 hypothetical protein [Arthrobacter cryoconiti]